MNDKSVCGEGTFADAVEFEDARPSKVVCLQVWGKKIQREIVMV